MHRRTQFLQRADEFGGLALRPYRVRQQQTVHAGNLRLARGINFGQPELVGSGKTGREFTKQSLRPGVSMRLKGDKQPAGSETLQRLYRRHYLVWMVAIIVENSVAHVRKQFLLPARSAPERCDGIGSFEGLETQLVQQRDHRRTVGGIFFTEQTSREFAQVPPVVPDIE